MHFHKAYSQTQQERTILPVFPHSMQWPCLEAIRTSRDYYRTENWIPCWDISLWTMQHRYLFPKGHFNFKCHFLTFVSQKNQLHLSVSITANQNLNFKEIEEPAHEKLFLLDQFQTSLSHGGDIAYPAEFKQVYWPIPLYIFETAFYSIQLLTLNKTLSKIFPRFLALRKLYAYIWHKGHTGYVSLSLSPGH